MSENARTPPPVPLPPVTKFKIGICQLAVTPDKAMNIANARRAIEKAVEKGAQLVLLPERWDVPMMFSIRKYAEDIDADGSPTRAMFSEVSRRLKITLIGGSILERSGDKYYNTCCVFGPNGNLLAKHRKLHLYNIGAVQESKRLTPGDSPTIVETDFGLIGIGICFDMCFEQLSMIYAARGAHLLCFPGLFDMTAGAAIWELFQRARAADNHVFVAACSTARDTEAEYVAWGHSSLVGPFGDILATTGHNEDIIVAEIDYSMIDKARKRIPKTINPRGDLYQLVDIKRGARL